MRLITLALAAIISISYAPFIFANNSPAQEWHFKVFLDDQEIGFHSFSVTSKDGLQLIHTKARFDVKFLFFTAYSYEHSNTEQWQGQCLTSIQAITDDNGDLYQVIGQSTKNGFMLETATRGTLNSECVKTFAYWDPSFLKTPQLLNSQTGELIDVNVQSIGQTRLTIGGEDIAARRYRLLGDKLQIDLWYSSEDRWLALESLTEGGRLIRYQMQQL